MAGDDDDHRDRRDGCRRRRQALEYMAWSGAGILWTVSGGGLGTVALLGRAEAAAAGAQAKPTIPIIVKDKTSFYWQLVLAGARKAGQDLGVNVLELGAQSETDVDRQIGLLETAVRRTRQRSSLRPRSLPRSPSRSIRPPRKSGSSASIRKSVPRR
jgi:hypothetical protein